MGDNKEGIGSINPRHYLEASLASAATMMTAVLEDITFLYLAFTVSTGDGEGFKRTTTKNKTTSGGELLSPTGETNISVYLETVSGLWW